MGRPSSPERSAAGSPTYDAAIKDGARQRLATLLANETLRVPIQATYPLEKAPEALAALTGGHTQGKVAIEVR